MRFLILNADYSEFLTWLYAQQPDLEQRPYAEQMQVRNVSLFSLADFYSENLHRLGHEAWDVHINNEAMQTVWAREHGAHLAVPPSSVYFVQRLKQIVRRPVLGWALHYLKPLWRLVWKPSRDGLSVWLYDILLAQIKHYSPDVLLNFELTSLSSGFMREIKSYVRLLVGQHAAVPLSDVTDFSCYDLVISSFPPTLDYFRRRNIPAELHRLGFEPKILSNLSPTKSCFDLSFIGSFQTIHSSRTALLEELCVRFSQFRVWGPEIDGLPLTSLLRQRYLGQAWGREMYQILRDSKMTLNHHGDIPPYANNMRLFEATGVGTLLITDWKENLPEMFEPGREVLAYRTSDECADLIQYYMKNDIERQRIALAGQQRTFKEHTYFRRMQELVGIVQSYL